MFSISTKFASFFKFLNVDLKPVISFIDLDLTLNLIGFHLT